MTWHVCITNDLPDVRSCIVRGEHRPHCDGFGRRYSRDLGRDVILDTECPGCLPEPAEFGFLCHSHVERLDAALAAIPELVSYLWSADSSGSADTNSGGGHAAAGPRWPLKESRVQAGWITAAMRNLVRVLDGDDWDLTVFDSTVIPGSAYPAQAVKIGADIAAYLRRFGPALGGTPRGAEACIRFVDLVQNAVRRFPLRESRRPVPGIRCPRCGMPRLVWIPPLEQLADVAIRCANCGHEEDQRWLEQWAAVMQTREAM